MVNYELSFIYALLLSISIETTVMWLFCRYVWKKPDLSTRLIIYTGLVTTLSTLPYVWFLIPAICKTNFSYHLCSETWAVLGETVLMKNMLRKDFKFAFVLSLTCNMASYIIGIFILR
jgi:hypothetical protein